MPNRIRPPGGSRAQQGKKKIQNARAVVGVAVWRVRQDHYYTTAG